MYRTEQNPVSIFYAVLFVAEKPFNSSTGFELRSDHYEMSYSEMNVGVTTADFDGEFYSNGAAMFMFNAKDGDVTDLQNLLFDSGARFDLMGTFDWGDEFPTKKADEIRAMTDLAQELLDMYNGESVSR